MFLNHTSKIKHRILIASFQGRLENGLDKLLASSSMVEALKENLIREQAVVEEKKVATDALIVLIGKETAVAEEQKESSRADEEKCSAIATEVTEFKEVCERDMAAAVPIIEAAIAALNSLDKASLTELKAFASPAKAVVDVMGALMVITGKGKIPGDRSWNQGKKRMTLIDIITTLIAIITTLIDIIRTLIDIIRTLIDIIHQARS
jgi:dynein heavy chain